MCSLSLIVILVSCFVFRNFSDCLSILGFRLECTELLHVVDESIDTLVYGDSGKVSGLVVAIVARFEVRGFR